MATLSEMLTEVEDAISQVLKGKSYSINGRAMTREDLGALREWRAELKQEIAEASGDGNMNAVVRFTDPS